MYSARQSFPSFLPCIPFNLCISGINLRAYAPHRWTRFRQVKEFSDGGSNREEVSHHLISSVSNMCQSITISHAPLPWKEIWQKMGDCERARNQEGKQCRKKRAQKNVRLQSTATVTTWVVIPILTSFILPRKMACALIQIQKALKIQARTNSCNTTLDGLMPIELVQSCFALEARVNIDLSDSKASRDQFWVEANGSSLL